MNAGGKAPACLPTWRGHIETTKDALLVFEACFNGTLSHTFRRPHDRERNQLIVSGNVFVYEEATSGIKRWTDGIPWSPSRILTNFLIYRQLNSPFPPGEKKRATKRSQRPIKPGDSYPNSNNTTPTTDDHRSQFPPHSPTDSARKEESPEKDANRGLVGSLVDSYEFKENGLLKKTMTVTVQNVQHHLVSYYSLEDAKHGLKTPREDPRLKDQQIRDSLINQPKFKFLNLDDAGDGTFDQMEGSPNAYAGYYQNGYDPSRMYAGQQYQVPMSQGYQYAGVYAPTHPPPSGVSYAHVPPASSAYHHQVAASHYPQHQHPQYYQTQGHSQYQSHPQASHYPPQHYGQPQQQQQSTPTPIRHSDVKPEMLPHRNGAQEYPQYRASQPEGGAEIYSSGGVGGHPPHAEGALPLSQAQQSSAYSAVGGYGQAWASRPESAAAYPAYRPQQ